MNRKRTSCGLDWIGRGAEIGVNNMGAEGCASPWGGTKCGFLQWVVSVAISFWSRGIILKYAHAWQHMV